MEVDDYKLGRLEGRVDAMENILKTHHERFSHHDRRLTAQERISAALLGAVALVNLVPAIKAWLT